MEIIEPLMGAIGSMPPALMITMAVLLIFGSMAYHYLSEIYPQNLEMKAKHADKLLELEELRNKEQQSINLFLRTTSAKQEQLLNQNNVAVQDLKEVMKIMSETFKQVSEKLALHSQASEQTNQMIKEMYREMPSQDDLEKIQTEIRDVAKDALNKQDADRIMEGIHSVLDKVDICIEELKRIEN